MSCRSRSNAIDRECDACNLEVLGKPDRCVPGPAVGVMGQARRDQVTGVLAPLVAMQTRPAARPHLPMGPTLHPLNRKDKGEPTMLADHQPRRHRCP